MSAGDSGALPVPPVPHVDELGGELEVAYSADLFGNWVYLDSTWSAVTGHSTHDSLSRPVADFVHPDDRGRHLEAFQALLRGEIYSSRHPARLLRTDGLPCWVEIFAYPTLDARGTIDGITGTIVDVTHRRKGMRALRESEARLRAISEASPLGLFVVDARGNCIFSNANYQKIAGLTPNQTMGIGWRSTLHPEDRDRVLQLWNAAARDHQQFGSEHRYRHSDGSEIWTRLHAAPIVDTGTLLGYVKVVEDVTTERLAEETLRRSRERLELALEGSGSALLDWDVPTGEIYVSEQWGHILGSAATQAVITIDELRALVHADDLDGLDTALDETLEGTRPFLRIEYRIHIALDTWKWIETHARVVERGTDGSALRVTGTSADITDRKDVERRQAEFVSTVSHELRTPLTSILGALDVVMDEHASKLPEDARKFFDIAYRNAARLSELVSSILDLERVEKGLHGFRYEAISVGEFVTRAVELNSAYAMKYSVDVVVKPIASDILIWVDADRLMQVMTNLMSNAAKFSPPGTSVEISADASDSHVRILVKDSGAGVPPEFRTRIFQRFAQAESLDRRQRSGSGLGLSISKALIERMSGEIGYESHPGAGAVFFVKIPRASGVNAPQIEHQASD
ncbi:MAG: PAS domain-containing protein [Betaproteobacteria bacterium]